MRTPSYPLHLASSSLQANSWLQEAQELGFLGPSDPYRQLEHAQSFVAHIQELIRIGGISSSARLADLGTGGGVPGLVVAQELPDLEITLVESNVRRANFLNRAVELLGFTVRVRVLEQRAELVARTSLRCSFDIVTARSFASPSVTAECGVPLLRKQGYLMVADPPLEVMSTSERWPEEGLLQLGLERFAHYDNPSITVLRKIQPTRERFPRPVGVPGKRPLF